MSERDIQNDVLVAVTGLPEGFFWRTNAGVAQMQGRTVRFNLPGTADIIGSYRGRFVGIEVKTETGRQSQSQKLFQRAVERAGGVYLLVRSAAEALTGLAQC